MPRTAPPLVCTTDASCSARAVCALASVASAVKAIASVVLLCMCPPFVGRIPCGRGSAGPTFGFVEPRPKVTLLGAAFVRIRGFPYVDRAPYATRLRPGPGENFDEQPPVQRPRG